MAESIFSTVKNLITNRDYREASLSLSQNIPSKFSKIEIYENDLAIFQTKLSANSTTAFDRLFLNKIVLTYNADKKVIFHYSFFNYATISLALYIIILITLYIFIEKIRTRIRSQYNHAVQQQKIVHINYLSQKLAHDIRSPISTLNLISSKITDPDIQFLQLAVVDQINAIANDLLNESNSARTATNTNSVERSAQNTQPSTLKNKNYLFTTLQNLEKEYQFKSNVISQKIIFEIDFNHIESTTESNTVTEKLCSIIYNCLNNFIQNSIEATHPDGIIKIRTAKNSKSQTEIIVSDNGNGIPDSILNKLGNEVISYGKSNTNFSGNGIAVLNAKHDLSECGAELKINSIPNTGTEITIVLPIVRTE